MDRFRFGRAVRALRQRRHWRQEDLALRAKLSRSVVGRVERGEGGRIPLESLEALASALDGMLTLDFRWRGESLERLVDEGHAALVDAIVRILRDAGWDVHVEVSFSIYGERGSIDVFGCHAATRKVAVVEVKGSVPDAGNTVIGVDRKSRLAPEIASQRGWPCDGVARFLGVPENSTSRDRIARHAEIFRTAFPVGGRESLSWIRKPIGPPPSGILFLKLPLPRVRGRSPSRNVARVDIARPRRPPES